VRPGLHANLAQFILLAAVNFFAGGMADLERTGTPLAGSGQVHPGESDIAEFVVVFGLAKAITDAAVGAVIAAGAPARVLIAGRAMGQLAPFMLAWGPSGPG
jgi:hypothetical protein